MGLSQQARAGKPTEKRRYACGHGVQKEKDKRCKIFKNEKFGAVGDRPPISLRMGDRKLENPVSVFCLAWVSFRVVLIRARQDPGRLAARDLGQVIYFLFEKIFSAQFSIYRKL